MKKSGCGNNILSIVTVLVLKNKLRCIKLLTAHLTETITVTYTLLLEELKWSDMLPLQDLLFSNPELEVAYGLFLSLTM